MAAYADGLRIEALLNHGLLIADSEAESFHAMLRACDCDLQTLASVFDGIYDYVHRYNCDRRHDICYDDISETQKVQEDQDLSDAV